MNLARETLEKLKEHHKKPDSVMYVTDGESYVWFDEFMAEAMQINYDDGFGRAEINEALMVVGRDWWLERYEYDGSEHWEYRERMGRPLKHGKLKIRWEELFGEVGE